MSIEIATPLNQQNGLIADSTGSVEVSIQVNKHFKGKTHKRNYFPNSPADWTAGQNLLLSNIAELIQQGKALRFGVLTVPPQSIDMHKSIKVAEELGGDIRYQLKNYDLCDLVRGHVSGFFVDIDGAPLDVFDQILAHEFIKTHCFLANYSASNDFSSELRRAHFVFLFESPVSAVKSVPYVKQIFRRLNQATFGQYVGKKDQTGKLDSCCFEPTRIKYGSIPNSIIFVNELARKITNEQIDEAIKDEETFSLQKARKIVDPSNQEKNQSIHFQAIRQVLEAHDYDLENIETWSVDFNHQWQKDKRDTVTSAGSKQTIACLQYAGFDFRPFSPGHSKSMLLSIADDSMIYYCARGRDNWGGNFFDYLIDWYVFNSELLTLDEKREYYQLEEVRSNYFNDAISDFLVSKNIEFSEYRDALSKLGNEKKRKSEKKKKLPQFFNVSQDFLGDDGDYLIDLEPLKEVDLRSLIRKEEGAKDVFKYFINAELIFELFLKVYPNRLVKKRDRSAGQTIYYWYAHQPGTKAYYWTVYSINDFHAQIWDFTRIILKDIKKEIGVACWESMTQRCNHYFNTTLSQVHNQLPINDRPRFYEDGRYRPYTNGLYDLIEHCLISYNPAIYTVYVLPYEYREVHESTVYDKFSTFVDACLNEAQKSALDFLLDLTAMAVFGKAYLVRAFIWLVAQSGSGKTSLVQIMAALCDPKYQLHSESQESIFIFDEISRYVPETPSNLLEESNRFKNAIFRSAYLVSIDDKRGITLDQASELKSIVTPNALVRDELKGVNGVFQTPVKSLIVFTGEQDPSLNFADKGSINRMALFDFQSNEQAYKDICSELILTSKREELDCYFATNFDYLTIEQKYKKLPECVIERQLQFIKENDPVYQFFEHCVDFVEEGHESSLFLNKAFRLFDKATFRLSDKALSAKIHPFLLSRGIKKPTNTKVKDEKGRQRAGTMYKGIRLKSYDVLIEYLQFKDNYEQEIFKSEYLDRA